MKWLTVVLMFFVIGIMSCHDKDTQSPTATYDIFLEKTANIGKTTLEINNTSGSINFGSSGTIKVTSLKKGEYDYSLTVTTSYTNDGLMIIVKGTTASGIISVTENRTCVVYEKTLYHNGMPYHQAYSKWE
jgi:hypothetical protein